MKAIKITVEYEDGSKHIIGGKAAALMQGRINSAGIMAGIEVKEEEPIDQPPDIKGEIKIIKSSPEKE